jgi:hypothetical protein
VPAATTTAGRAASRRPTGSLSELGITLDDQQGDALWDEISGCVDFRELFLDTAEGAPPEAVECIDDALDDDLLRRLFLAGLTEGDDALEDDEQLNDDLAALGSQCSEALGEG